MIDLELELLSQNDEWRLVLQAYSDAREIARQYEPDEGDWLSRVASIDGVQEEHLPRIHGKLIALGLLHFQLTSRNNGVVYRISPQGRQALNQLAGETECGCDEDTDDPEFAQSA